MKRFLAFTVALSFFLLCMPLKVSAMADDESDASFYLNYWVEEHTGINMKEIPVTAYGLSYADYIYRQTGYTVDYIVDTATNPSYFGDNTSTYIQNTLYNDAEYMKDLLSTTPITETTSQTYATSYNQRVNADGDINVSGSNYWNSVYNGISQNGYNDQYTQSGEGGYNGTTTSGNYSVSYAGFLGDAPNTQWGDLLSGTQNVYTNTPVDLGYGGHVIMNVTYNGNTGYYHSNSRWGWYNARNFIYSYGSNYVEFTCELYDEGTPVGGGRTITERILFNDTITSGTNESIPVLQPDQVGYIIDPLTGNKIPVYTDPSLNPFTPNGDGTVSFPNDDTKYPIYIDPEELSPYGDLYLLQYIINNYYGNDYNDFDPFSNDPANRLNYPDGNTKDYTAGFNSVISWLKKIYNKEVDICKYLKQIVKGLPLSNEEGNEEDDEEEKFEDFEDMLSLFNGSNDDGFKQRILNKLGYAGIQTNINNFSTALFGSRTFNPDGTVNTQFGSTSVTETPQLLYSYNGTTHNFWDNLTLINENGDLTRAKEYVRFFVIFAFFLGFFRGLPSFINNVGGIFANSSYYSDGSSDIIESNISQDLNNNFDQLDHLEFFGSPFPDYYDADAYSDIF